MRKGFTLIELLAVIVILAIIALIVTPIILNIINDSKEQSRLRSAENYVRALTEKIAAINLEKPYAPQYCSVQEDGNLECYEGETSSTMTVKIDGQYPTSGIIRFNENGNVSRVENLFYGKNIETDKETYFVSKENENSNFKLGKIDSEDPIHGDTTVVKTDEDGNIVKEVFSEQGCLYTGSCYSNNIATKFYIRTSSTQPSDEWYSFYVIKDNGDGTVNLISERNFCSDGTYATETNTCLTAWGTNVNEGPTTAMNEISTLTENWDLVLPLKENTYSDVGGKYTFNLNGYKARLATSDEFKVESNFINYKNNTWHCGTGNKSCPGWIFSYLDSSNLYVGDRGKAVSLANVEGYWTMDTNGINAYYINYDARFSAERPITEAGRFGIRPVIRLSKETLGLE